ncbi:hypothetical protein NCC49_001757 [Naganishia albida]|nr:hypothetical protein NCC49_001757 [Naganishia albida]
MAAPPKKKPAPIARKSSAAMPPAPAPATFYAGPTVPKKAKTEGPLHVAPTTEQAVTGYSKVNVDGKDLEQIVKSKNIVPPRKNARSHRWLNSTILFILLTSLFSLYACPAPNSREASLYTRLNPFIATPHLVPAWESIVCKPTDVYRTRVLEPYVVPHVKARIGKVRGNPIVRDYVEPLVRQVQHRARAVWAHRLERPVGRIYRVLDQIHTRYAAPRYPIIKARAARLVTYIRSRITHYTATVSHAIRAHPTYADASRRVSPLIRRVTDGTLGAWNRLIPHVHRAAGRAGPVADRWRGRAAAGAGESVRLARTSVVPRLARGVEGTLDQVEVAWERLIAQSRDLYATHVYPLLHPHYTSLQPRLTAFSEKVYEPYLRAPLDRARPLLYSLILTPSLDDIRRALRVGYLDTRAAVSQGVESVRETLHGIEDKVESVVADVKATVGATASSVVSGAPETVYEAGRNYRQEAIDRAHAARRAAGGTSAEARASVASGASAVSASVASVTERVAGNAARATAEGKAVVDEGQSTVSSILAEVQTGAAGVASGVSDEAQRVSASLSSAASRVSVSAESLVDRATRSAGSVVVEATQGVASATESISAGARSAASDVSASGSSLVDRATRSAGSVASAASQDVRAGASAVSEGANRAAASVVSAGSQITASAATAASRASEGVRQAGGQVVASGSSVVDQARSGASQVSAQASHTVSSIASQGSHSASSVSSRVKSAVEPNAETLDPLEPSATEFGTNPGKTTVPHNPEAGEVAALFEEEGVAHKVREVGSQEEIVAKDSTYIKQEVAGVIRTYLQTQVPRIAQDRLVALEHDATTTARAFQQLLSGLELSSEAKDVAAERAKVKASLKSVRSKLDNLVATLEKDLQGGLINTGAKKEVARIIDAAMAAAGPKPPSTLRQAYNDAAQSVLDTLNNVNEAIAQEARLVLKPYRKEAKDRADQAVALLDGKATAAVIPTETVGRVAEAAAGTIGRAKDQIIADIKHATDAGSSVYESATEGAASAASTAAGKMGIDEQAEAVLAGLADFRSHVEEVVEDVTQSGKAGAARVTQAVKEEL